MSFDTVIKAFAVTGVALLAALVIELMAPLEKKKPVRRLPGIAYQAAFIILAPGIAWPISMVWDVLGVQFLPPLRQWAGLWSLPTLIVVTDFLTYWEHRFEHRFFWGVHKVHHSPTEIHAANTFGHPLQAAPTTLLIAIPLSFLNAEHLPLWAAIFTTFWALYIHSPVDFHAGKLGWLLVDNRFHRVHHSVEERHHDRNFANMFAIWDRLFGTACDLGPNEWPAVGIAEPEPRGLVDYLTMPFRATR